MSNISVSRYHYGKRAPREAMVGGRATDYGAIVAWVNTVGGQDELVFDGNSVVFDASGKVLAHASSLVEDLLVCDVDTDRPIHHAPEKLRYEAEGAQRLDLQVEELTVSARGSKPKSKTENRMAKPPDGAAATYAAVVLGTHGSLRNP